MEECLEHGVVAVEWPGVGAPFWRNHTPWIRIGIGVLDEKRRRITVEEMR